ncbi:50S ribosomal protein L13 [Candidatus Peregrinibacteria bacterium CG10_big_fil_rev_8_21_14_0_10_49_10]|nr:MAG: 50S ribosomal protein L13 [Candidatus Peregrinibacteria bacterium CG10_big_fil_rev_8_21_14_0_10_49_10]
MRTSTLPVSAPSWVLFDAEGQSLGRMSTRIAHYLRGKQRSSFSPHQLCGDHVVVINASKLAFTQKKLTQKTYKKHSGYMGHLKVRTLENMMEKSPEKLVNITVKGMLPANRLRPEMLKRLHVFTGAEHPYAAQQPTPLPLS